MSRSFSKELRIVAVVVGLVGLADVASAQPTQTKETLPAGAATVTTVELKGEVVAVGSNWLVAKNAAGEYRVYNVQPGQQFIIDGAARTLGQLEKGTMLTARVTTTQTPVTNRTTTITEGTVFWSSPTSLIATLANGENKQYAVPPDFKFDVDGRQLTAMELRPGMKLRATKIVEEPVNMFSKDIKVTGTTKK